MHNVAAFGVSKTSELLPKILMDGAWTRCQRCRSKMPQTHTAAGDAAIEHSSNILKQQAVEHADNIEANMRKDVEKLKCVVCQEQKIQADYSDFIWYHRNKREHNRCRACFKCPTCPPETKHILADFIPSAKICNTCSKTLTCVVCKQAKPKIGYSESMWKHQKVRQHIRCQACLTCPKCPAGNVRELDDFTLGSIYCKRCDTIACSACKKQVQRHLCRTTRDKSVVLCVSCADRGCTLRDPQFYRCDECYKQFGVQHYVQKQIDNMKHLLKQKTLICKTCAPLRPQRLAKLKRYVSRSRRICHCSKVCAPGLHVESCLTSDKESTGRWPGSDEGITLDDFRYLQRCRPGWWMKALGKAWPRRLHCDR